MSLAVINTYYTISTDYGLKIQATVAVEPLEKCKGPQNSPTPTHLEPHQLHISQQKREETKFMQKRSMSEKQSFER